MDDVDGGHEPTTSIEARAYTCYDQSRAVHYSGAPESIFTVQDFTCTDGRAAKWIQGRSLVSTKTSLVCNQLFHADNVIQCSIRKGGALCILTWHAMASDQLTAGGSLHSKAARKFVGRSVLVLSNEQGQHFLRLLGKPDQAAELHAASMVRAPKKVVRWKSCISSVIPSSKGGRGDEAFHRSPLAVKNRSICSNSNIIPAVTMDTKNKSSQFKICHLG